MKHLFLIGAFTLTLFSVDAGLIRGETDFREATWGMTPAQVKTTEPADRLIGEMPGVLAYEGEIAGVKASIFYLFEDNELNRGIYSIETGQETVINDYETIRAFLLERYGEPAGVKMGPEDGKPAGKIDPADPDNLYTLVLRKAVSPETVWERGGTRIYLQLAEKDGRVAIMIGYIQPGI